VAAIKADPAWADDVRQHVVALIPAPTTAYRPAAE
jgi:hypothetical protein